MGFIKRANKKFDYKPRFYQGEGNPYKFKHTFDEYRTTVGKRKNIKGKFTAAYDELKESDFKLNKTILIIALVLVLLFFFLIDFDLSIFLPKN